MSRFPKLTETFILNEILSVESLGVRVEVYPLLRERQPVEHEEVRLLASRVHYLPFLSAAVLASNWRMFRRSPRRYLAVWREVLTGTFGSLNFFGGALGILPKTVRFAEMAERQGLDHVHAHFATHPALAALVIHRLTGIPFSFTAHGSDLHVDRRMLPEKVAAAAFAVTVSDYNRSVMVQECGEEARPKIEVVRCGVDTDFFTPPSRAAAAPAGPLRLLCVASLVEVKGHEPLLMACARLRDQGVDFRLELIGDGPLRARIEDRIRDLGLGGQVCLAGPLPRHRVAARFREADVAVQPSIPTRNGKREGIPVSLMEAMASGLPVVASDLSGIPELVRHEDTGLLVAPGDSVALAAAIERLRDPVLRQRLGTAGRAKVCAEYSLRVNASRLVARMRLGAPALSGCA